MIKTILKPMPIFLVVVATITLPAQATAGSRGKGNSDITQNGLPKIKSAAAIVVDLKSGQVLFEKNSDEVRPIASISKMFAALVLMEECKLDPEALHEMTPSNRDAARGGDKTKLTTGWSYSHNDLLHAALMRSDNRAFPALAEACGFDPQAYAAKMNQKAKALGLTKTNFHEPDGLSPENVSTPREVLIALKEAIRHPVLTDIMGTPEYVITAQRGDWVRSIKIRNTDRLLNKNIAEVIGGKTGYTDLARYCLAVAARTDTGRELGMVFLGAEGRYTRFADFERVIKWVKQKDMTTARIRPEEVVIPYALPTDLPKQTTPDMATQINDLKINR